MDNATIQCRKLVTILLLADTALLFAIILIAGTPSNNVLAQPLETTTREEILEFLTYENAVAGISLEYPSDWTPIESNISDDPTFIVGFVSPPTRAGDQFAETFAINIETVPEDLTLQEYTEIGNQTIRTIFPGAEILTSRDDMTLSGEPANVVTYTATLENGTSGQITQVWTVTGGKAYVLTYRAESNEYEIFTPVVDRMIGSFQIISQPAAVSESIPTTGNNASDIEALRAQFLSGWEQLPFTAAFSTFIEPNSDRGYGVYSEHRSNVFNPDDTVVLYLEPIGFRHEPVLGEEGEELYQINLTASVLMTQDMSRSPVASTPINQTVADLEPIVIVSHRQNTEMYMTIPIYLYEAQPPLPEGDYTISYTLTDGVSGQSFTIEENITIAETVSPTV